MTSNGRCMATTPTTAESSALDWLLKKRIEEIGTTFRAVWDYYIKFYTVFLTFSLGAMGWLVQHTEAEAVAHHHVVIAVVFIGQSLLTAATSAGVALYSHQTAANQLTLEKTLLSTEPMPKALKIAQAIPVKLALWSGFANTVAMLGMAWQ